MKYKYIDDEINNEINNEIKIKIKINLLNITDNDLNKLL